MIRNRSHSHWFRRLIGLSKMEDRARSQIFRLSSPLETRRQKTEKRRKEKGGKQEEEGNKRWRVEEEVDGKSWGGSLLGYDFRKSRWNVRRCTEWDYGIPCYAIQNTAFPASIFNPGVGSRKPRKCLELGRRLPTRGKYWSGQCWELWYSGAISRDTDAERRCRL